MEVSGVIMIGCCCVQLFLSFFAIVAQSIERYLYSFYAAFVQWLLSQFSKLERPVQIWYAALKFLVMKKEQYYLNPKHCKNCNKEIPFEKKRNDYCNNQCQNDFEYKQYIENWKSGYETGTIKPDDISGHVVRYMFEKYNSSCQACGWKQINPYTLKVPLQIHHIDGNCLNNSENNLQLLCPNCHSLTENFGSRNKNCTRVDKRIR